MDIRHKFLVCCLLAVLGKVNEIEMATTATPASTDTQGRMKIIAHSAS